MKRMVDNAQTLNQVAKYTDVVENKGKATLQWEGDIEVNGKITDKNVVEPKKIVRISVPTGGMDTSLDTAQRYYITRDNENTDDYTDLTINLVDYKFSWDNTLHHNWDIHANDEWLNGCTEGWDEPEAYIVIHAAKDTNFYLYVWFDEANKICHLSTDVNV